jgi:hypothetical protein
MTNVRAARASVRVISDHLGTALVGVFRIRVRMVMIV